MCEVLVTALCAVLIATVIPLLYIYSTGLDKDISRQLYIPILCIHSQLMKGNLTTVVHCFYVSI